MQEWGEPIFNNNVFEFSEWLYNNKKNFKQRVETLHPVMTTSLPINFKSLESNINAWCKIKNELYNGQAGLQFSINSTDKEQRDYMFGGSSLSLEEFSKIAEKLPEPVGRKYCLNFAYATGYKIDGEYLASLFDKEKFMCKITPIHNNTSCKNNGIETLDGYSSYLPYVVPEESLKAAGFDVLVFVPSMDEENGIVTCGNAILGGSTIKTVTENIKIIGVK